MQIYVNNLGAVGERGEAVRLSPSFFPSQMVYTHTEPVFLNVYGAPESIPRNEFRQPM